MNKEQTTIEVDALEWWEGLTQLEKERTANYHHISVSGLTIDLAVKIYTAEHPTAPTVKEDSGSEDTEAKVKLAIEQCKANGYPIIHFDDFRTGYIYGMVRANEEGCVWGLNQRKEEIKKLEADNKLLKDALQWMITMYQLSSDYKNLSPSWQQKTNEAIAVLGQTK